MRVVRVGGQLVAFASLLQRAQATSSSRRPGPDGLVMLEATRARCRAECLQAMRQAGEWCAVQKAFADWRPRPARQMPAPEQRSCRRCPSHHRALRARCS